MKNDPARTSHVIEPAESAPGVSPAAPQPPRVTVETALWILVVVIALALRLARLDAAPLNGREARAAMLAWRAVTSRGMPEADYSPLLFAANALLFFTCGASDALARLWPALAGGGLALAPCLLRRRIGRVGALAAGLYLAISPTMLFTSRQVDGTVLALVGGMAFLGGVIRFAETEKRAWLTLSAVGLALAVTASSSAYGMLAALGLAYLGLSWAWPSEAWARLWRALRPQLGHALAVSLCAGLALSTGLGWNLPGLGVAGGLLAGWFSRFGPAPNPVASPLAFVFIYEPLALLFGLGGLVDAVRRGHRFGVLLGLWGGLAALSLVLMPGRTLADVLWVVLPLAVLVGLAAESLARGVRAHKAWSSGWLYALVVLVLWGYLYLRLARYVETGSSTELLLAWLSLALQGLLAAAFAMGDRPAVVLRAGVVGVGMVFLGVTLSAGWGVVYARPADPRELLVREPTAIEVRDLVETLRDLSWQRTGAATTVPFTFEAAPDSVLAWYLRDFSAARRVESLAGLGVEEAGPVIVTCQRILPLAEAEDAPYAGQDFPLRRDWDSEEINCARVWPLPPECRAFVKWLLFRDTLSPSVPDRWAVLWLYQGGDEH
jgi:uncharacterized protein (TIGR03663 family)